MDPPDEPDSRPSEAPDCEPSESRTTPPVSLVSKLTVNDSPVKQELSKPDDSTQESLCSAAPVTVFKQEPEAQPGSHDKVPPSSKSQKICGVCDREPGKYKCPRCGMYYCSVPCSKAHKANHPPDPPPQRPVQPPSAAPTGLKRPHEPEDPYSILLEHKSDLERLFAKYPNLEFDLIQIERATLPPPDAFPSAFGGLPTNYQPPQQQRQQEPWTRQVGLRKGVAALKKARMDPSEDGDAVREYCELVVHLLSTSRKRREDEALEALRRETADEERGIIKKLIKMEED